MSNDLLTIKKEVTKIIKKAGSLLKTYFDEEKVILSDEDRDIKTLADHEIESLIKSKLSEKFNYPLLGEESSVNQDFDLEGFTGFIIDPLDGTMNFSRMNPICCISIGFVLSGEFVLGVIYNPFLEELFVGIGGEGAYVNENKVILETNKTVSQSILSSGIPTDMNTDNEEELFKYFLKLKQFKKLRMIGSAAQSIAWIANHRVDAYMEDSIMIWDVAAGLAIVSSAGGVFEITPVENKKFAYNVKVAVNKTLLNSLR